MFQRFTPEARRALDGCFRRAETARAGTDHLLLGLLEEWSDVAAAVAEDLGLHLPALRAGVERLLRPGQPIARDCERSYTPGARRALMFAQEEAWRLDDACIGTEHLLLGLTRESDGSAGRVLRATGVRLDELR